MPKPKTPVYTRKAIDKYRQKKDLITITTEKGTRERMRAVNITAGDITRLLYDRLEELEKNENLSADQPEKNRPEKFQS